MADIFSAKIATTQCQGLNYYMMGYDSTTIPSFSQISIFILNRDSGHHFWCVSFGTHWNSSIDFVSLSCVSRFSMQIKVHFHLNFATVQRCFARPTKVEISVTEFSFGVLVFWVVVLGRTKSLTGALFNHFKNSQVHMAKKVWSWSRTEPGWI